MGRRSRAPRGAPLTTAVFLFWSDPLDPPDVSGGGASSSSSSDESISSPVGRATTARAFLCSLHECPLDSFWTRVMDFRGSAGEREGMKKTTSGGYFLCVAGAHQPVPSSEAHSLLHHARQADERALRAVVARHANLMESEGRARGLAGAPGRRRASSDGVDKVQKTFATIWRQTPPRATGRNGARSTFELGGRGGGARERASGNSERRGDGASIEYRSNVDIRVGSGWVQTARGGAASPRPTRRFDVFALLAPSERGTEEETRYGSERGGAHLGVLAQQGQSLIVEIVATSLFLPFRRHYDR